MNKDAISIIENEVREEFEFFREIYPFDNLPKLNIKPPTELYITDTSLRDGQQGWRPFTVEESIKIYQLLNELDNNSGIIKSSEFFLYTDRDKITVKKALELGFNSPRVVGWIRATKRDLELAISNKVNKVVMLTSISDYHIYYKFRLSRKQVLTKYIEVIEEAFKRGIAVRATLEDSTRADVYGTLIPFIKALLKLGEKYGFEPEIKIADTLGLGVPFEEVPLPRSIPKLIKTVIKETGIPGSRIEFHGHNDFYLVVANHVSAWLSGASMSNCTLFGMGERAGNCPLEAMIMYYVQLRRKTDKIKLKTLTKIKEYLERMGYILPEFYPIFGANAFRTKAGIHIDGLLKNPHVYLPFNPITTLGLPYLVSITPYSGRAGIAFWIKMMFNIESIDHLKNDQRVEMIYRDIVEMFQNGRVRPLSDREMLLLVKKHMPDIYNKFKERLPKNLEY